MARSKGNIAAPQGIRPIRYNLELKLDPQQSLFSGQIHILLLPEAPTNCVVLDSQGLVISEFGILDEDGQSIGVKSMIADEQNGKLTLIGMRRLDRRFLVSLSFRGVLSDKSIARRGKAYAHCYEQSPSRCFPCINDVRFRAAFHLQLEIPDGHFALSLTEASKTSDNKVLFGETQAIPAHMLAFAFGPLDDLLEMEAYLTELGVFLAR